MGKHEPEKSGIGTLTVFVVVVFLTVIAYTATVLWYNWNGREVQDSLNTGFYGLFGAEFGITGGIQVAKTIKAFLESRRQRKESEDTEDG